MDAVDLIRTAGWHRPPNVSERHYFRANETRSLCHNVLGVGARNPEPSLANKPDTCELCRTEYAKGVR